MNWEEWAVLLWAGTLAILLGGCQEQSQINTIVLNKDKWACTETKVTSIKPYLTECVTYRKLR